MTSEQLTFFGDVHRFARRHVAQELKAQRIQRHAFRSHHILGAAIADIALAQHQRTDAVRVAEGDHAVADNHRHAGVSASNLAVGGSDRRKNVVCFQRIVAEVVQLAGEDIQQDFRIGGGVDMAAFFFKQLFTQLVSVSQVTVVR